MTIEWEAGTRETLGIRPCLESLRLQRSLAGLGHDSLVLLVMLRQGFEVA